MKKLAIICLPGLDNFLQWTSRLQGYETQIFVVRTETDLHAALNWCDVAFFEWANETAIHGVPLAKGCRPVVVRLHSYEVLHGHAAQVDWTGVDRLILVADHMKELFEAYVGPVPQHKIIPNGINFGTTPFLNPGHGTEIAMVGGISNKKNYPLALQIMDLLPRSYTLHVAGEFQEARQEVYLRHMVDELKLNVIFYGHVSDMGAFWHGKNYLLHTSIHEGHCVSIIEAMARGIMPVIHNFYGADRQYPRDILFNAAKDAAELIEKLRYDVFDFRTIVKERGWTLEHQAQSIKEILDTL